MIPRDTSFGAKQEMSSNGDDYNTSKASSSSTTTTASWSRLKDPRIVRVSRAVGGKDRHSKVCTVRGLRDRRVRLSVQTAIQLYDLQERLGLNQPSKVVDWLLDAAKHEINELPPLQIPQGTSFTQMLTSHHSVGETSDRNKQSWTTRNEDQAANYSSFSTAMGPYSSSYGRWDPSNLTLSQTPTSLGLTAHQDQELHNFSVVYQSGMIAHPYFTPPSNAAFGAKQPSFHSSDLSSTSLTAARPFNFNMTADLLPSQDEAVNEHTKRD